MELGSLTTISGGAILGRERWHRQCAGCAGVDAVRWWDGRRLSAWISGIRRGRIEVPVLASCTVETITVQAASLSLPDLSDIDGSNITVSAGSHLTLPAVTTDNGFTSETIEATGAGSELTLPALSSITGEGNGGCSYAQIRGVVRRRRGASGADEISGPAILLQSDGTGSVLDAPALTQCVW